MKLRDLLGLGEGETSALSFLPLASVIVGLVVSKLVNAWHHLGFWGEAGVTLLVTVLLASVTTLLIVRRDQY